MTEPSDETTVVVDINEPERVRLLTLDHPDTDDWNEMRLSAADIVVNGVGFERKTPSDFLTSMSEGRLTEQAEKLADAYEHAYVLLEGGFGWFRGEEYGPTPESARGMAASLTARYGIPVIPTGGPPGDDNDEWRTRMLVDYAIRQGRKHTEDPTSGHLPTGPVGLDEPSGKRMWGCLPNIGPTLADALFEEFGPLPRFARTAGDAEHRPPKEAMQTALETVDGIGEVTAGKVTEAMFNE